MNNLFSDLNIEVRRMERDVRVMDSDIYPIAWIFLTKSMLACLSPGEPSDKLILVNTSYTLPRTFKTSPSRQTIRGDSDRKS